jgi:type IV pilus assembly protein PilW
VESKKHVQVLESSKGGFTLIELMISLVIFGLLSLAAFSVLVSGQQTAIQNDQTVQVQQNVRLAMDLISRDLRMAGYGNPAANSLGGCANHITATDSAVGPDSISVMTVNQQVGTVATDFVTGNILRIRGVNGQAPSVGNGTVITIEGVFTAKINGAPSVVDSQTSDVTLGKTDSPATPQGVSAPQVFLLGTPVLSLTCVTYTVNGAASDPPFQLMRNTTAAAGGAVALVDGIESIQFAYALDADNNGTIDEQAGSAAGVDCLDYIPNRILLPNNSNGCTTVGTVATLPASMNITPTPVRQIRITVVARAIPPAAANRPGNTWRDPTYTTSSAIITENVQLANAPGIRRRTLTKIISLRNTF